MPKYSPADLCSLALVGHGDSGKTSLAEAFLFKSGATNRMGSVADGSAVCDFDPEEKDRKISLDCAATHFNWKGREFQVLDTPGYSDFVAEAISGLAAVETAGLCINAYAGIMVNTRKMWEQTKKAGVARVIFINKCDLDNIDLPKLLGTIQEVFGDRCRAATLPLGTGPALAGVASVLEPPADLPAASKDEFAKRREQLLEAIVEADDAVMEQYLEGKPIAPEVIVSTFQKAIKKGTIVPIFCTSVRKDKGVDEALTLMAKVLPNPLDGRAWTGKDPAAEPDAEPKPVKTAVDAPFVARAYKVAADPFVKKLSCLRVLSGTVAGDGTFYNPRTKATEKVGKLLRLQGKEQAGVAGAAAGDLVAIPQLETIQVGDTLCADAAHAVQLPPLPFPVPMVSLAVEPKARGDEARLSVSLHKMADSDPTFKVSRDRGTGELLITGVSQLHLEVSLSRMKRRYDVALNTKPPKIPYLETICLACEGHYKHKKQTGGRGQFGEVYLKIAPLERGAGFQFVDEVVGGSIPRNFLPAIEKGIREICDKGILAGYPVVDVQVTVTDGSYHDVDSDEISFKLAGGNAFKEAFQKARPVLMEPGVVVEVTAPTRFMGDITGNLNSRRGRILGMDTQGGEQIVRAAVPLSEVMNYATELRSMTGGEGQYAMEFAQYDVVPQRLMEGILLRLKAAKAPEAEA